MNTTVLAVLAGVYLLVFPITIRLACHAQKKLIIDRYAANKKADPADLPKPWWPKVKERIAFTFKDKRPLKVGKKEGAGPPHRIVFLIIWAVGLLTFLAGNITSVWYLYIAGFVVFLTSVAFGIKASNDIIVTRERIYKKMFEIGRSKLGQPTKYESNPRAVIEVTEWIDYIKPNEVKFQVPTTFGMEGEEGFLRQFNQVFGRISAWVSKDDPETGESGWNYEEGSVTIRAVPPLPMRAKWSEHYVLNDKVAWSFFPIALGVENGVELENPQTGEVENVLGFDLSGNQAKIKGVKTSAKIGSAAPMALVGGGTGGGKSLSTNTIARIVKK